MYGTDLVAVGTDPAGFGNFRDLIEQDRILQLSQDRFRIFKKQHETLRPGTSKQAGQPTEMRLLCGTVLKRLLDNDPHVLGDSTLNQPPAETDTPKSRPLPSRHPACRRLARQARGWHSLRQLEPNRLSI